MTEPEPSLDHGPNPAVSAQPGVGVGGYSEPEYGEATPTAAVPVSDHGTAGDADQARPRAKVKEPAPKQDRAAEPAKPAKAQVEGDPPAREGVAGGPVKGKGTPGGQQAGAGAPSPQRGGGGRA